MQDKDRGNYGGDALEVILVTEDTFLVYKRARKAS